MMTRESSGQPRQNLRSQGRVECVILLLVYVPPTLFTFNHILPGDAAMVGLVTHWQEERMIEMSWSNSSAEEINQTTSDNAMTVSDHVCNVSAVSSKLICPVSFKSGSPKRLPLGGKRAKVWLSVSPRSASPERWASSSEFSQLPSLSIIVAGVETRVHACVGAFSVNVWVWVRLMDWLKSGCFFLPLKQGVVVVGVPEAFSIKTTEYIWNGRLTYSRWRHLLACCSNSE